MTIDSVTQGNENKLRVWLYYTQLVFGQITTKLTLITPRLKVAKSQHLKVNINWTLLIWGSRMIYT